ARSLGQNGWEVVVGETTPLAKAGFSRFCKKRQVYPSPQQSVDAFISWLLEEVKDGGYDFLLPMTEATLLPISARRDEFLPYVRLPIASHEAILNVFNKAETLSLAMKKGVPTPQTWFIESLLELPSLSKKLPYPVVIKPRWSSYWSGDRIISGGGASYVFGPEELVRKYLRIHQEIPFPLIQSFSPGKGYGIYTLFDHGKPKLFFAHERVRDVRPTGSGSALRKSVPPDPLLKEYAVTLLEAVGWHGVAMVEFKWDKENAAPVLMEINGRFWNSLSLAIAAGVDFPSLLLEMEQGKPVGERPYEADLFCRWFVGDCRHLLEVFRGAPARWPGAFPERWPTLLSFLKSPKGKMAYDTFRRDDPLPEAIEWLHFFFSKLPGRLGKSRRGWIKNEKAV
ncbi:MAG TPA: ATP-grasp domain-containing protein, partial [Candidatus Manganitrophaceae bacterium]|nr:ATP-grasp domain-containing protein [Candidatus Manganitrophaceae bacterium]